MRLSAFLAGIVLISAATSAHAVQLTVMAVNSNTGVAGYKAYTVGVKLTSADVAAGGAGAVLGIQSVTFTGGANGPYQAPAGKSPQANQADIQGVQTTFIDGITGTWPPTNASLAAVGPNAIPALYQDSWWYNSNTTIPGFVPDPVNKPGEGGPGGLVGYNNQAGTAQGVVTTGNTTGPNALPYQNVNTTIGPTSQVGTSGFLWQSTGGGIGGGTTTGSSMSYTGFFGPLSLNHLDAAPLSNLLTAGGGTLTVPLAQVLVNGNVSIADLYGGGFGTFLTVGTAKYDLWGQAPGTDTALVLDFNSNTIHPVPEPASFVLAGLSMLGGYIVYRRRGKK